MGYKNADRWRGSEEVIQCNGPQSKQIMRLKRTKGINSCEQLARTSAHPRSAVEADRAARMRNEWTEGKNVEDRERLYAHSTDETG